MNWFNKLIGYNRPTKEQLKEVVDNEYKKTPERISGDSQVNQNLRNESLACLRFDVLPDGTLGISVLWENDTDITSASLGTLLYYLNSGALADRCTECLVGISQQRPDKTQFIQEIFDVWRSHLSDEPLIKPSDVFDLQKGVNQGTTGGTSQ